MTAQRFRKKPVEIEAMQLTEDSDWEAIAAWCGGRLQNRAVVPGTDPNTVLLIDTLEGTMEGWDGDWIIRGVQGEFYPCKPDIFESTYEEVSDG